VGVGLWGYGASNTTYVYQNPYYVENTTVESPVDYSQPIQPEKTPEDVKEDDLALAAFDEARAAFKGGDYATALAQVNTALKTMPNDAVLHEFRALVLFATGKYSEAAAGVYAVLAAGPGWDWTTMRSLYPSAEVYTQQLRALETYRNENPKSADARFLLAYHYITCGYNDAAARELEAVTKLLPKDKLAAELLKAVKGQPQE